MREDQRRQVLVVEDDVTLARVVQRNLEHAGLEVLVAYDGREAWELLQNHSVDVLVTNHGMPRMSGAELCRLLRNDERFKELPIVMLTAKALEADIQTLRTECRLSAVFTKPFSPTQLVRHVYELCEPG